MKDSDLYNDEELIQQVKADNMFAFDILYKKYYKRLFKFGYSILKSQEEAENLIQDVFLKIWENRSKVEKDSSIKYYLFTIAYNSAISVLRRKARESQFLEYLRTIQEIDQEVVSVEVECNELTNNLDEVIKALPRRQKEIFLLHRVKHLKYIEIAEQLHISVNTVENHISRALKTIREKVGKFSLVKILFFCLFL